ncbi:RILP-like protein 1 [Periophthalmus magnuspinnatus]|uniref:RILP-like protein 1 n=1 Tax=Periophthalmus magnuspinnatus TaxID=409849 RepID=UPI002436DFAA|nr:RILP-like protein 1 [Periophthalmus magnuspinnatus]
MESGAVCALDRPAAELTVVDVYDIAALLGHEFERVIDRYGCEAMIGVVPKVVRVLELLEALVNYGGARNKAEELQLELDRLRQERNERYEQDRRHQMELELVEDVWRSEVQDLLSQISQLQSDNKKLQLSQAVIEGPLAVDPQQEQEALGVSEKEREVLQKLKMLVEKQRDEIRSKENELSLRNCDVEALQLQQSRVMKMNQEQRHRLALMETQGKALVQQRAELEAVAQARLQDLGQLKQDVSRLQRELQDLQDLQLHSQLEPVHMNEGLSRAEALPAVTATLSGASTAAGDAAVKPSSVWMECAGDAEFLANCFEREPLTAAYCEETQPALLLDRSIGADVGDDTDSSESDSPRFTLQELRDVLHEKNQLKAQVFLLQEELAFYKPEECEEDLRTYGPSEEERSEPAAAAEEPESGIRRLIFTAIMPMVAAGLISDDPTLIPIRRFSMV